MRVAASMPTAISMIGFVVDGEIAALGSSCETEVMSQVGQPAFMARSLRRFLRSQAAGRGPPLISPDGLRARVQELPPHRPARVLRGQERRAAAGLRPRLALPTLRLRRVRPRPVRSCRRRLRRRPRRYQMHQRAALGRPVGGGVPGSGAQVGWVAPSAEPEDWPVAPGLPRTSRSVALHPGSSTPSIGN